MVGLASILVSVWNLPYNYCRSPICLFQEKEVVLENNEENGWSDMGLFKWAAKSAYYSTKSAGRSIARDVRSITHLTYEHPGCDTRHRSAEAMSKCRKGY